MRRYLWRAAGSCSCSSCSDVVAAASGPFSWAAWYTLPGGGPAGGAAVMVILMSGSHRADRYRLTLVDGVRHGDGGAGRLEARTRRTCAVLRRAAHDRDNPIFGVGPLNFKSSARCNTGLEQGNIAHTLLEVAAEFGLPVFIGVSCWLLASVFRILNARRGWRLADGPSPRGLGEGLRSGLTGILVAAASSAPVRKMLWLAVFVTICSARFGRRGARGEAAGRG